MGTPKPRGTILFSVVGRIYYGFDIFSVKIPPLFPDGDLTERRLTDGISVNFNGSFIDEQAGSVAYVSERTGSPRIYRNRSDAKHPESLPSVADSIFHDRPTVKNGRLYFVSAHEPADQPLKSSTAVYAASLRDGGVVVRLTPRGAVDYSPAVSRTGNLVAVASYGFRPWPGDLEDLKTDIVVFRESEPGKRTVVCDRGGWPTWSGDSTVFFHRKADDGWWSIFRLDLPENFEAGKSVKPIRVTPPGVHVFTPSASHDGKRVAVATRRPESEFRHVEIYNTESGSFHRVTEKLNPGFHHYNPFFSPESGFLGYHRFRGEEPGELTAPHLERILSPIGDLKLLRVNGFFPSFSANGDLIAMTHRFQGLQILKRDGSKRWAVLKDRVAFQTSWSPTEKGVVYTSVGPIFESPNANVQIARVSFDPADLVADREEIPSEVKILTEDGTGNNAFPSCSPDGKSVVFRSGRSGHKNLYIVDAVDGEAKGAARRLTEGPWVDTMPSWSPDGELIAFSSNRHKDDPEAYSVYLVRPDGTGLRRVALGGAESEGERANHVCFSPDSRWLLFTANLGGVTAEPISLPNQFQPYGELFVSRLDGGELRRLTWNAYEDGTPAWHSPEPDELDLGGMAVGTEDGEPLRGQFQEPLWITFDV
ncbi:hypothetical protein H6P81_005124 [Aristolochia fimbriata]|uniref:Uncharacterized protein n=1 Tax=Aristolochia fimbriata TaxID=158543 RepID=A0AAV7ETJ6_ARIFI|nr:hypothetical protein H6P81_005124 [Aristolochia fimbriata]